MIKQRPGFDALLKEVLGFEPEWTIDMSDQGQYFLKFTTGTTYHTSEGMGDGIISLFSIVDSLYDSNPNELVVIDEPELSLHPAYQRRLAAVLQRYSQDRQIVVTTHSPYFVDLRALAAGAQLARMTTTKDHGSQIFQLSDAGRAAVEKLIHDRNNPHILGLDAREMFFQEDKILLTEGQDDVQLLPKVAEQLGTKFSGNLFGWGAGGAEKFDHLCLIFKELGFKKVAGVLDGDKKEKAAELSRKFPDYQFITIPADDVKTKEARAATPEEKGLLDDKSKLRNEYEDDMKNVIAKVNEYLK